METEERPHRRMWIRRDPLMTGISAAGEHVGISPYRRARKYVYDLLLTPDIETRFEAIVRRSIAVLIVLSVAEVVIGSVPTIYARFGRALHAFEVFAVLVFTVEYLLRIWAITLNPRYSHPVWGRLRYSVSFFALVDLVAIVPFYLPAVVTIDLLYLRALRLLRLARILKLGRYSEPFGLFRRVFAEKREELAVSVFVGFIVLLISSSVMYYIEREAQPDAFPHIPAALWWGIATLTTIGYGDIYPVTALGKICAAVVAVVGIALVALPSGILVSGFIEQIQHRRAARTCPHCGMPLEHLPGHSSKEAEKDTDVE